MKLPAGDKKILLTVILACIGLLLLLAWVFRKKIAAMIFDTYIVENKEEFLKKANSISAQLGIQPDWLMAVMAFESEIDHRKVNRTSGATGLIQFMPSTAESLGTTTDALKAMTNVQQLDYVYKYLAPYKGKMKKFTDVYLTVFYPAAVGKADTYVIGAAGGKISKQNPALRDSAGNVTVASVKNNFSNWVSKRGFTIV
ncbi:MAG: transglycosylase SLT domain-containing protein [Bacteroidales bacterium]|jgi:hypothetical protein|nr:transglycosylase SLT domain-containing protein [Bacteroidales bacterium]